MPFEPAPKTEVRRFQRVADALLRGIGSTTQPTCFGDDKATRCAFQCIAAGIGHAESGNDFVDLMKEANQLYRQTYRAFINEDSDSHRFTREQIAARIAAL